MSDLEILVNLSNKYGADPGFVLVGGGNTSVKNGNELYIKGSGTSLKTIMAEQFVRMDRARLAEIWKKDYPTDADEREAEVLNDLMESRCAGEETKRPSVETLFHDLFSQKYVLHVHPAKVNGVLCSKNGRETVAELFPESIWLDACEPGYVMASAFRRALQEYEARSGKKANLVFHQNHGVFFAADTAEELDDLVSAVINAIDSRISTRPDLSEGDINAVEAAKIAPVLRMLYDGEGASRAVFKADGMILGFASSRDAFEKVRRPLSPDHIVY